MYPRLFGFKGRQKGLSIKSISSLPDCVIGTFGAPALEISALLEVCEAVTMYVHASYT